MTKEQKIELVDKLVDRFQEYSSFYIANTGGLTVAEVSEIREACFNSGIQMQVIKNTLIKKALDRLDFDYSEAYPALKQTSAVFFTNAENPSAPAKVIDDFRKKTKGEVPELKAAVIETAIYLGDENLETLTKAKSKDELVGDIVALLQSPAKNVISALKSSGGILAGLIKTLQERDAA